MGPGRGNEGRGLTASTISMMAFSAAVGSGRDISPSTWPLTCTMSCSCFLVAVDSGTVRSSRSKRVVGLKFLTTLPRFQDLVRVMRETRLPMPFFRLLR